MSQHIVFRPSREAAPDAPFGVRSAGRYSVVHPWREKSMRKFFVQVFWCVRGVGNLPLPGSRRELAAGQCACYYPGDEHAVSSAEGEWEYAWWTMDGPLAADIVRGFGLQPSAVWNAGPLPEALFAELYRLLPSADRQDEVRAAQIAYELLARASGMLGLRAPASEGSSVAERCRKHFDSRFDSSAVSVKTAAVELGVDRSYLSRAFREAYGIPPKEYLRRLRIGRALSLLRDTDMPIAAVAMQAGFENPSYFTTVVHSVTGHAPAAFRERFRNQ